MSSAVRPEMEQPRWANSAWRHEHLRQWGIKQRQLREPPGWKAKRERWAQEAAESPVVPPHIANLVHAVANSAAPLRPEVRAEVEAEIERRIAAHFKEDTRA
jgi:hypothetical protein